MHEEPAELFAALGNTYKETEAHSPPCLLSAGSQPLCGRVGSGNDYSLTKHL